MSYSGLNLKDEELKISQIVKYFHDSPSILDYLSILEGNVQTDKDAQETMRAIEQNFKSIVVDHIIQTDYSIYPIVKSVFQEEKKQLEIYDIITLIEAHHYSVLQILNNYKYIQSVDNYQVEEMKNEIAELRD